MCVICSSEERLKIDSFKRERKMEFEREEQLKEIQANNRGESYTPQTYNEPADAECLEVVRNGWQSKLDKRFALKGKKEGWLK